MTNMMLSSRQPMELKQVNQEETILYSMKTEPFFKWVMEHPERLNDPLMNALTVCLLHLGIDGKQYIRQLSNEFPFLQDTIDKAITTLSVQVPPMPPVGYEALAQIGYTGPYQMEDPVTSTLRRVNDSRFRNRGLYFNPKGILQLNPNVFAKQVLTRMNLIFEGAKGAYVFEKSGKFDLINDDLLKKICRNIFHEAEDDIWRGRWETEYIKAIEREMPFVKAMDQFPHVINLKNGMLDLNMMTLEPHEPKYLSTIQIGMNYEPDASSPQFLTFLRDIFENDQERVDLIQELLGYCFLQEIKIQKGFIFLGPGSNGMSVLAEIIRHLLGVVNVSNVALNNLSGQFGMQSLPGKLVNISSENEFDMKFNTQNFKMLTGGDAVNVEMKYRVAPLAASATVVVTITI